MHQFDPDISLWTNQQLEEARTNALENLKAFITTFGEENDLFLITLRDVVNTIETEIAERGLKLVINPDSID